MYKQNRNKRDNIGARRKVVQERCISNTEMESKHLTTKNRISDFFGSGIDSGTSGIAGDPPRGL